MNFIAPGLEGAWDGASLGAFFSGAMRWAHLDGMGRSVEDVSRVLSLFSSSALALSCNSAVLGSILSKDDLVEGEEVLLILLINTGDVGDELALLAILLSFGERL